MHKILKLKLVLLHDLKADTLLKQASWILRMSCPPTQEIGANTSEGEGTKGDQGEIGELKE